MQVAIEKIKLIKRLRSDNGDIKSLMNSMKKYGLLNPITIDRDYKLIAGQRRLDAAVRLGWTSIDAVVMDTDDEILKLELELEENIQRKNLTQEEISLGFNRLNKLLHPNFFQRILNFFKRLFKQIKRRLSGS